MYKFWISCVLDTSLSITYSIKTIRIKQHEQEKTTAKNNAKSREIATDEKTKVNLVVVNKHSTQSSPKLKLFI